MPKEETKRIPARAYARIQGRDGSASARPEPANENETARFQV
jgi:hypothetical protein